MTTQLALVELKLLLRKWITAFSVVLVPVGLGALVLMGERPSDPAAWGRLLGSHVLLLSVMSTFLVTLTVFTARRQSLVLKRLRTSSLSDVGIVAGVLGPAVAVGLAQIVCYLAFCVATGAPAPSSFDVVPGIVLCVAVATALGVATACLSRSVEATQLTGAPVVMTAIVSLFLTSTSSPVANGVGLALPFGGPADLVARGWSARLVLGNVPVVLLDLASSVLWLAVAWLVIRRAFRWEPRV